MNNECWILKNEKPPKTTAFGGLGVLNLMTRMKCAWKPDFIKNTDSCYIWLESPHDINENPMIMSKP